VTVCGQVNHLNHQSQLSLAILSGSVNRVLACLDGVKASVYRSMCLVSEDKLIVPLWQMTLRSSAMAFP